MHRQPGRSASRGNEAGSRGRMGGLFALSYEWKFQNGYPRIDDVQPQRDEGRRLAPPMCNHHDGVRQQSAAR